MKIQWTCLALASGLTLAPGHALAVGNMVVSRPVGGMRIQLSIPLASDADFTTPLTEGRLEIAPAEGRPVPGGRRFVLTMASLRFADFNIDRAVFSEKRFRRTTVELREAVAFTAIEVSPDVYTFSIPRDQITFAGSTVLNGDTRSGVDRPSQPVTGTIHLGTGVVEARAVVPKHYGCDWSWPCSVDGTLTVTLIGLLGPDTDGDGVRDSRDNCPLLFNPRQQRIASPVITAPPDITVVSCQHSAIGRPEVLNLCERGPVAVNGDVPSEWRPGVATVTWTAQAPSGRTASAQQQVIVDDRTAPSFKLVPPPIVADTCGPIDIGLPVAYDDCDFGPPAVVSDAPKVFGPGVTRVTWTLADRAGNRRTAAQVVTVKDAKPPVFTFVPPDVKVAGCEGPDIGRAVAEDDCGVTITNDAPKAFPVGEAVVVTWTARDGGGNVATARQAVTCVQKER